VTPAARLAAAIEVLDTIAAEKAPADQVMKAWGRARRFAGSTDRRVIAERAYQCLRARARLAWLMGAADGRALVLGALAHLDGASLPEIQALFSGEGHAPAALTEVERARLASPPSDPPPEVLAGVPGFVAEALPAQYGDDWLAEAQGLVQPRAPVDLRVNGLKGGVDKALSLLAHEGVEPERSPLSTWGLRLPPEFAADIQKSRAFRSGWIEVQDEGSQLAAFLAGAEPGWTVVDYCAGGGGKTLALAQEMRGNGRLVAMDVNPRRLDAVPERLERAGAKAELRRTGPEGQGSEDLAGQADLVLVDAPCSGSGTWRRRPEGAWRVQPDDVARLSALQAGILARAAGLVKPGGRLAYVTCSIFDAENAQVAERFAADHPGFAPRPIVAAAATPNLTDAARARLAELAGAGHTVQLTPRRTNTDGFFIALFERTA
jgi:16S rRNA (cytosine967-C5)-methyltransferase